MNKIVIDYLDYGAVASCGIVKAAGPSGSNAVTNLLKYCDVENAIIDWNGFEINAKRLDRIDATVIAFTTMWNIEVVIEKIGKYFLVEVYDEDSIRKSIWELEEFESRLCELA